MAAFRKKPVTIEAIRYTGENGREVGAFVGYADRNELGQFVIATLEGEMCANPGDWIIRGVQGEFYPCTPDVFAATYEAVEDVEPPPGVCGLCGGPLPEGEKVFRYHGFSGPCPKRSDAPA